MTNTIQINVALAKELTERADGGMKVSGRGMARLVKKPLSTFNQDLYGVKRGDRIFGGKLGKTLRLQGFEVIAFSTGIPDEAIPHIATFYAKKDNETAQNLLTALSTIGARVYCRTAAGLPPTVEPVDTAESLLRGAIPFVQKLNNIERAVQGTLAGLKTVIDQASDGELLALESGNELSCAELLNRYSDKPYTHLPEFRNGFCGLWAAKFEAVTDKPAKKYRKVNVYPDWSHELFKATLTKYQNTFETKMKKLLATAQEVA